MSGVSEQLSVSRSGYVSIESGRRNPLIYVPQLRVVDGTMSRVDGNGGALVDAVEGNITPAMPQCRDP